MRMIDGDALEKALEDTIVPHRLIAIIRRQPTIEPKRGRWIDDRVAFYRHCSECGANVRANLYEIFLDCDVRDLNYCPHCGADMRERKESEG